MKAYWYHKGETGFMILRPYSQIYGLTFEIPNSSQIWVPVENRDHPPTQWFVKTSRGIVIPTTSSDCKELRTALLLEGIPCP